MLLNAFHHLLKEFKGKLHRGGCYSCEAIGTRQFTERVGEVVLFKVVEIMLAAMLTRTKGK